MAASHRWLPRDQRLLIVQICYYHPLNTAAANLKVSSNEDRRSLCTETMSTRLLHSDEYSSAVSLQWKTHTHEYSSAVSLQCKHTLMNKLLIRDIMQWQFSIINSVFLIYLNSFFSATKLEFHPTIRKVNLLILNSNIQQFKLSLFTPLAALVQRIFNHDKILRYYSYSR